MKKISLFLLLWGLPLLSGAGILAPGERITVPLPDGKMPNAERLIVTFTARCDRPMNVNDSRFMIVAVNGKRVDKYLSPGQNKIPRLVNRTSPTFHGSGYNYTDKNSCWSVVSCKADSDAEHIYFPADFRQLHIYAMDVTDFLGSGKNSLIIGNTASPAGNYPLHIGKVKVENIHASKLPDPVERSFSGYAVIPNKNLPLAGTAEKIRVEVPRKSGFRRVLRFRARLGYTAEGSNGDLKILINDRILTPENENQLSRLLNRGAFFRGGNESIIASHGRIVVAHRADWGIPSEKLEDLKVNWYYLDIDDMLHNNGGTISLQNVAFVPYFKKRGYKDGRPFLLFWDGAVGYVPEVCAALAPARKTESRKFADSDKKIKTDNYVLSIAPAGGLQIEAGKQKFFVETLYSYPRAGFNAFLCDGAKAVTPEKEFKGKISEKHGTFTYEYSGKYYSVIRTVKCAANAIHVSEKITNLNNAPLGMKFEINMISANRAQVIRKNGSTFFNNNLSSHRFPCGNTSLFWGFSKGDSRGLGIAVVDDIFRMQADYRTDPGSGGISTSHLGFAAGKSHTLRYTIYILPSADYFDFVNAVRRDWGVNNRTIPGFITWNNHHIRNNPDKFKTSIANLGTSILIDGKEWYNARKYHERSFNIADEMKIHTEWKNLGKTLCPDIRYLLQFQMVFSWRNQEKSPDPMADSAIINHEGHVDIFARARKGAPYSSTYGYGEPGLYHAYHYPMIGNSYYRFLMDSARVAMDNGFNGVYYDTPEYDAVTYGRFTFDRWDDATVDLNDDFTIARKYADVNLISVQARYELYKYITGRGGIIVLNAPPHNEKIQQMPGMIIHHTEGDREDSLARMHFSTPVVLGQYPRDAKGTPGYTGSPRKRFLTGEDFMQDMVWKISNGVLYAAYWPPKDVPESHEWPTRDMYPITVTDIHGGWIRGKERIITVKSGKFGWENEKVASARIRVYGKNGCMISDSQVNSDAAGQFEVKLPESGMAIIIR